MDPLVSIVIPCHNAAPWLAATIASARAQTWARKEIVLIDDGSTDESGEIARRLAASDMKVVRQENKGPCAALNAGLRIAQGDFIEYLDADDLLDPQKISIQVGRLRGLAPGWMASCSWARFQTAPQEAAFAPEAVWKDLAPVDWIVTSWSGGGMIHGAAWLTPRSVVDAAGPWNESLTLINDLEYFCRLVLCSAGVAFCQDARTYYRSNVRGSMSRRTSRSAWESAFRATELSTQAVLSREDSPRVKRACAINYMRLVFSAYPSAPDLVRLGERRVRDLGGCDLSPDWGPPFQVLNRLAGWKLARRAQVLGRRLRGAARP